MSVKINKPAVIKINKSAQTVVISDVEGPHVELRFNPNSFPVTDPKTIDEWNQYFDITTPAIPFNRVKVDGSTVKLYGGSNITIKQGTVDTTDLTHIIDNYGCITEIEQYSFYNAALLEIAVFSSVININEGTFSGCSALTAISLPSILSIGSVAFYDCTSLSSVYFPNVTTIGTFCFSNCSSLTTIYLPSVIDIYSSCFNDCISLTDIYIPNCTNLGGSTVPDGVFSGVFGQSINLTVPALLLMVNGGNPDGDIQLLQSSNTVNLIISTYPNLIYNFNGADVRTEMFGSSYALFDWGDGNLEYIGVINYDVYHNYAIPSNYTIKVYFLDPPLVNTINMNYSSGYPGISDFELNNLPNLSIFSCDSTPLTSANFGNITSITNLNLSSTSLTNVNVSGLVNLDTFSISSPNLVALNLANNTILTSLTIGNSVITSLDLNNNTQLEYLFIDNLTLTSLDLTYNTQLQNLGLNNSPITSLDLTYNTQLQILSLLTLNITSIDLSSNTQLSNLVIGFCPITSLDISSNTLLTNIILLDLNTLTTLDISNNPQLVEVYTYGSALTTSTINNILYYLDTFGLSGIAYYNSLLNSLPPAPPSIGPPNGIVAKANLITKGWNITTD